MKIRQMRQILEVSENESINRAAQKLYISQSALSASISSVEEELGQQLLVRSHSGIALTEFGKKFVEASRQILEIYDRLLLEATPENPAQLSVSCQYLKYVGSIFLRCSAEFADSRNSFRYAEKVRGEVCKDVMNGTSDIGIIVPPADCRERVFRMMEAYNLECHLITTDKARCLVGPNNPFYHKKEGTIRRDQMAEYPQIQYEHARLDWEREAFPNEGSVFPNRGILLISDSGSFQNILKETDNIFVGLYNEKAYSSNKYYSDIRVLDIEDMDYSYDTIWVCRKGWHLTPFARKFLRDVYTAVGHPVDAFPD